VLHQRHYITNDNPIYQVWTSINCYFR